MPTKASKGSGVGAAVPQEVLTLPEQLKGQRTPLGTYGNVDVDVVVSRTGVWVLGRRPGAGGWALRTAFGFGGSLRSSVEEKEPGEFEVFAEGDVGTFRVAIRFPASDAEVIHAETRFTPAQDLLVTEWPRDFYPLDDSGAAAALSGEVLAAQRGMNGGLCYLTIDDPGFGTVLYFQDLTRLNSYFLATGSKPDGRVGGQWPELGYAPPLSVGDKPLRGGTEVTVSSAFIAARPERPQTQRESGRFLVELLAAIYPHLERPQTENFDWPAKARESLRDLEKSPKVWLDYYGNRYARPYTDAEYPDSMVQLAVMVPLFRYGRWRGRPVELTEQLWKGYGRFFDKKLQALRRYLPNVGQDKDPDKVDSWYLYHPLSNLGRLALLGHDEAKSLFFSALDYGIEAAHRLDYAWPVFFHFQTFEIMQAERQPGKPGQSDVGGLYAYVMQQAHELSGDDRYLEEAGRALRALEHYGFDLLYQSNLTNLGAVASLKQWRLTGDEYFRDLSMLFLANGLHNCVLWDSEIENARHYNMFLGATCLHDGPYMAMYECWESSASFLEYLRLGGDDLSEPVRVLLSEFYRYGLDRARYFYPQELPADILSDEVRNGHIDRSLAFPLEDLYAGGEAPGQVGQEVYGVGAAFHFTEAAFHPLPGAGATLFCEAPLLKLDVKEGRAQFITGGTSEYEYRLVLTRNPKARHVSRLELKGSDGSTVRWAGGEKREVMVKGGTGYVAEW